MNIAPHQVSNHETWLAASWLFADDTQFNRWLDLAAQLVKLQSPASLGSPLEIFIGVQMEAYYQSMLDKEVKGPGLLYDLLSVGFSKVNWPEIAQLIIDSYEEH